MRTLIPERLEQLVLLGAHCDDIAIGAGGTLLRLCQAFPELRVHALVLTGAETERADEESSALAAFCPKAQLELTVLDLPDGRLPAYYEHTKNAVHALRERCEPDVILAPAPHDAHQDHRELAAVVPTVFRDHLILGYEIPKLDADLVQPQVYVPFGQEVLAQKLDLLRRHYSSQRERSWFDTETFTGLARIRGVQCQAHYAEGFHVSKIVIGTGRD